jgi:hypothetical protein
MRRIFIISLTLALALILVLPSTAAAASSSFSAEGNIEGISPTVIGVNAIPLGNSGKWRVIDRDITGTFTSGDLKGEYILTYGGVFDIQTQSGCLTGTLKNGDKTLFINAKAAPLTFTAQGVPVLEISGHWNGVSGIHDQGTFNAWVAFIPDADGHIVAILDNSLTMSGKYQGKQK